MIDYDKIFTSSWEDVKVSNELKYLSNFNWNPMNDSLKLEKCGDQTGIHLTHFQVIKAE